MLHTQLVDPSASMKVLYLIRLLAEPPTFSSGTTNPYPSFFLGCG